MVVRNVVRDCQRVVRRGCAVAEVVWDVCCTSSRGDCGCYVLLKTSELDAPAVAIHPNLRNCVAYLLPAVASMMLFWVISFSISSVV